MLGFCKLVPKYIGCELPEYFQQLKRQQLTIQVWDELCQNDQSFQQASKMINVDDISGQTMMNNCVQYYKVLDQWATLCQLNTHENNYEIMGKLLQTSVENMTPHLIMLVCKVEFHLS